MGTLLRNLSAKAKDSRSGSSNEALESSRSVFERDYGRIDKPRFLNHKKRRLSDLAHKMTMLAGLPLAVMNDLTVLV